MDFDAFKESYKPHIRPPNAVKDMERAFQINAVFREKFRVLKPYLPARKSDWGDRVVDNLVACEALEHKTQQVEVERIRNMYRQHSVVFRAGAFDEAYLDSIEDIALYFAFCDVKTLWIARAYADLTISTIDFVFDRGRLNKSHSVRLLMHALTGALSLELNQIQRTFTMYERYVSDALVKDLSFGGMLTTAPKGVAAGRGINSKAKEGEDHVEQ